MEILMIFILFFVFSIIRALLESEKKMMESRGRRAGGGSRPREKEIKVEKTPLEIDWQKIYAEAEKRHAPEYRETKSPSAVVAPTVRPSQPPRQAERRTRLQKRQAALLLRDDLVRGVIMAEILGRPRAFARKRF